MANNVLRSVRLYVRKAEIKLTGSLTLTTFRKSFAQNHADAATPPKTLAKILGHSDVRITMTYYNRATDANERAAAVAMDHLLRDSEVAESVSEVG
jgi:integrase